MHPPTLAPDRGLDAAVKTPIGERRFDLDWLRVFAILLLLLYHCGMAFVAEWRWHIKNRETSELFQEWMFFMSRWRMALLFFISGVGTFFVIRNSSAGHYIVRRFTRLFIPLLFGMAVVVPPQIYFERIAQGVPFASYLEFYPSVFELKPYPAGNTSWHHLWFIAYLFVYSILGAPIFIFLKGPSAGKWLAKAALALRGWHLYLFGLPLAIVYAGLIVRFPGPQDFVHDWAMFSVYFLFFLFGYLFSLHSRFWDLLEERRQQSLKLALLCLVAINYLRWNDREPAFVQSPERLAYSALLAFNSWCWVLAILGYGKRYLNYKNRLLAYANEGIYPFYILHQTVIVAIAFYVVKTSDTILAKFIFLVVASFLATMAIYHFLIRPYNLLRFFFGMKPHSE